MTGVIHLAAEP